MPRNRQAFSIRSASSRASLALLAALVLPWGGASAAQEPGTKSSKVPTPPQNVPSRVAAAHILIAHADGQGAPPGVSRSREEARQRAQEALEMARKPETKWADAVTKFSDDPRGSQTGGSIGVIERPALRPEFKALGDALFSMEVGQVSDVVESPLGFHILTRLEIIEYAASHILIQYQGSERADATITRTKAEAEKLAAEVLLKAQAAGADFAALATEHSDGPSGPQGGSLGIFLSGQMVPEFEDALRTMQPGDIRGPVETPFGFHVIRRDRIERVGASHILIGFEGATRSSATRTKEEALELAGDVLAAARKEGADFAALAKKHSEGPSGPSGGSLGVFGKGRMVPAFDKAVFDLEVGEVVGPVETQFGYHIILRTE